MASFKLVRVGLRVAKLSLPTVARLPEESAENVGICPRPEDVPGVDVDRIFLDCRQEGYL